MLCISNKSRKRERLLSSEMVPAGDIPDEAIMGTVRDLHEFLQEAELDHYYNAIKNELKIATIPQLKYVEEDDLNSIGMTKPEMRRLKKFYKKECPQGKLHKLKQAILTKTHLDGSSRSLSPSPPEHRTRPQSYIRHPGKQIISLNSIHVSKSLGEGEFGVVQQGVWTTEDGEKVQVAIKCLSKEKMHTGTSEFLKEAGLMQSIEHENIARMYGVVLDKDNALMLVTELAPMRSLLECLKETSLRPDFPIPRLCDFAQQICDGMSYLESKRLIHRDLAARNILVFSKTKVKISDFGLSRALGVGKDYYQSNFSVNLKLPIAWCAPECINYLKFTSASDVWAYAVTVWEMFTFGFQPWAGMTGQQILDAIDIPKCLRLEKPDLCSREYYKLMLSCWDQEPEKRPTFSEIFIRLPQMRPTQVKAVKDFPEITVPKHYLYYKAYDIIIVLDKTPNNPPRSGLWTGATINGKNGYFDPTNVVPFIEPKSSPVSPPPKPSISRKDSKRISSRKLRADMISRPQNDLRHTGHIGYDGAVFGDVSFIGDNYDKLPLKVMSTGRLNESGRASSSISHSNDSPERDQTDNVFSNSLSDLRMNGAHKTNGFSRSWISQESLDSTSLLHAESEGSGTHDGQYQDIDDDSLLSDFKMPDISSSFDFGPSFMDEVLKALNEKEAAFESSQNKASSSSPKDNMSRTSPDRNLSISPPKDMKFPPPPLPVQSPRAADSCCDMKTEPRKQAKVKPMSASEEKMIDDAMALANELDRQNSMSQMVNDKQGSPSSPTSDKMSDSESGSESPKLLSKIKMSIKRSPKIERKRTFSEEMATRSDLDESVPPEAQEAYNMLVVHGSAKEVSKNRQRPNDNVQNHIEGSQRDSVGSGLGFNYFDRSSNASSSSQTPDRNSQSPERRTPDRSSPVKNRSRSSSERSSVSPPSNIGRNSSEKEITPDRKIDRPVPRPRLEAKRSEIPVPKPRPEINRVEPTPRQPPPPIPEKVKRVQETTEEKKSFLDTTLVINEDDFKLSEESVSDRKQIEILRVDLPNSNEDDLNASSSGIEFEWSDSAQETNKDASQKSGTFDEEFSEPSPREIMSKLARESRLRRSIEHQRGLVGEGDAAPNRNLRAPQGIPGKSFSTSGSLGDDDDEVDTNPLRMLRGGAIPIRGGRGGSGTRSSNLQYPKIHISSTPAFHHSLSVDTGSDHLASIQREADANSPGDNSNSPGPALPPRCFSVYDRIEIDTPNLLPLPPKNPRRPAVESLKTRERKYPLALNNNNEGHLSVVTCITTTASLSESCQSSLSPVIACSPLADNDSACSPLHDSDKGSYPDLPPAPPPPIEHDNDECTLDDSVFEGSDSPQISKWNFNLSRDGGSSGASTFPRGMKFGLQNVKWNLEQLGFYNNGDPFWVKSVVFDDRSYSDRSASTDAEASPLMLANYKTNSEGVSYEDLLDFALDRQKNGEEIETMQKLLSDEITAQDCVRALEETKWDLQKAIKYIKLKQLLSIQLGDVNNCKTALLACDWDIQRAADYMLSQCPPSPECIDV